MILKWKVFGVRCLYLSIVALWLLNSSFNYIKLAEALPEEEKPSVFYYLDDKPKQEKLGQNSKNLTEERVFSLNPYDLKSSNNQNPEAELQHDIVKPKATVGKFYGKAHLMLLDIYSGKTTKIIVSQNQVASFGGMQIILHTCWQEDSVVYQPEAKAMIEINDEYSNGQIFAGWVLARHRALSQPKYQNYMVFLQGCLN